MFNLISGEVQLFGSAGNFADVDANNRLKVTPDENDSNKTIVNVVQKSSMSGTQDNFYTITNGKTLTLKRLSGSCKNGASGAWVEIFEDATGTGTPLVDIEDMYLEDASYQKQINLQLVGDGTRRVLLRRRNLAGGSNEITGRWEGFEE